MHQQRHLQIPQYEDVYLYIHKMHNVIIHSYKIHIHTCTYWVVSYYAQKSTKVDILYGGKLWHNENLVKLMTDQNSPNFHYQNFYTCIVKSYVSIMLPPLPKNIEKIEDIFLGMLPTTCRVPSIIFLIATACRLCISPEEFPVSHSRSKSLSARVTWLSQIDW